MESTGKIRKLWTKYKSYILYLIFGGVTTLVNWLCFYVCAHLLHMGTVPANIIAWIVAVVSVLVPLNFVKLYRIRVKSCRLIGLSGS